MKIFNKMVSAVLVAASAISLASCSDLSDGKGNQIEISATHIAAGDTLYHTIAPVNFLNSDSRFTFKLPALTDTAYLRISFGCNNSVKWAVDNVDTLLTVSPLEGAGSGSLFVAVPANRSSKNRTMPFVMRLHERNELSGKEGSLTHRFYIKQSN